jgi:hypothetical protein
VRRMNRHHKVLFGIISAGMILGMTVLAGCSQQSQTQESSSTQTDGLLQTNSVLQSESSAAEQTIPLQYEGDKTWFDQELSVNYPVFFGEGSDGVNEIVRERAVAPFEADDSGTAWTGDVHYVISTQTEHFLSLNWQGEVTADGSTQFVNYTMNLDLETGKVKPLAELVTVDENFTRMVLDYVHQYLGKEYIAYVDSLTEAGLMERLQAADTQEFSDCSTFVEGNLTILLKGPEELGGWVPITNLEESLWKPYVKDSGIFE